MPLAFVVVPICLQYLISNSLALTVMMLLPSNCLAVTDMMLSSGPAGNHEYGRPQLKLHLLHHPTYGQEPRPLGQQRRGRYLSGVGATPTEA